MKQNISKDIPGSFLVIFTLQKNREMEQTCKSKLLVIQETLLVRQLEKTKLQLTLPLPYWLINGVIRIITGLDRLIDGINR